MALFEKRNLKEAGLSVAVAALSPEHDYHGEVLKVGGTA
jgi:hypothetical protein